LESKALALDIAELKGAKAEALDSIISDNFQNIARINPFLKNE